jgi:hypothetical protein
MEGHGKTMHVKEGQDMEESVTVCPLPYLLEGNHVRHQVAMVSMFGFSCGSDVQEHGHIVVLAE